MQFLEKLGTLRKWQRRRQQFIDTFGGYDHNLRIREGSWYDEENMSAAQFPLLQTRQDRVTVREVVSPGGIITKDALCLVENGAVKINDATVSGLNVTAGDKQLISMGAYLVIWPDKKYVNTQDLTDCGDLGASFSTDHTGSTLPTTVKLCKQDGTTYDAYTPSASAPENPSNGDLWLDTSNTEVPVLKEYSGVSNMWVTIPTTFLKIESTGLGASFEAYDGVEISGFTEGSALDALNGSHVIYAADDDWVVIVGVIAPASAQALVLEEDDPVTISRDVPDMDFVCECGNRLWGCKYGVVDGEPVNELYASKLGDPKNWNCYMGLSTDSWSAGRGSDGVFTGAIAFQGHPMFFKENCIEKVYPSTTGAHQVVTVDCRGVQKQSWRSLVIVDEVLYYKSIKDVCAFTGSLPVSVSEALGEVSYGSARGGAVDSVLYMSMQSADGAWHLFTYDTAKQIWHREDDTKAEMFTEKDGVLYFIDETDDAHKYLRRCNGGRDGAIRWSVTSGVIGLEMAENEYISRFVIRLETYGLLLLEVRYDNGPWEYGGYHNVWKGMGSVVIPVTPRRCDHMQFRLSGDHHARIYSIAKYVQQGSDVHW